LTISIDSRKASTAFKSIIEKCGRDDVTEILFNWDDCELGEDSNTIIKYVGRDREYSHGKDGGKVKISKKQFLTWLLSDDPFDVSVYGSKIREDIDWVQKINSARSASGLRPD